MSLIESGIDGGNTNIKALMDTISKQVQEGAIEPTRGSFDDIILNRGNYKGVPVTTVTYS